MFVSVDAVMVGLHDIDDGCYWRHCQTQPPAQSDDQCSAGQCVHCTLGVFCSAWVYFVNYELISHEPISLTDIIIGYFHLNASNPCLAFFT